MLVLNGPLEFMFYSIPRTNRETAAHAERSHFPSVTGQKSLFISSTIIILLYQSAIYYKVLTIWQRPIYNAGIGGMRLAYSVVSAG